MMTRYALAASMLLAATPGTPLLAHTPACAHEGGPVAPAAAGEYVENKGQWDDRVMYRADFGLVALFVERDRLTFSKWEDSAGDKVHDAQHEGPEAMDNLTLSGHTWRLWFEGADPAVEVDRGGMATSYFNYFLGNDPGRWASYVRHFDEVRYHGLWPGVDLRLYDQQGNFKYDVELARAADVARVRFRYEGLDGLRIGERGELVLSTSVGEVQELAPVAWYADGAKEPVDCRFTLKDGTVGFRFARGTNMSRPVVIDPVLIASTLSGTGNIGTTQNYGHTATYDADGNIYTGAICFGQGYPTNAGSFQQFFGGGGTDISVSKLNATGTTLLFATYLGGSGGDYPHSLVVTPAGELTVYGTTASANYPVSANAYDPTFNGGTSDIVVTKLNPTGSALVGSTYMGTAGTDGRNNFTTNYGDSYRGEVISDAQGRIYIASCTNSAGFPTSPGAFQSAWSGGQDGVVFCLSPNLSQLVWGTYFGTPGGDMCFGIKLNSVGEAYVSGGTDSGALSTTPGAFQAASNGGQEAFVAHFSADASQLLHCTYLGTPGVDVAFFVQLDLDDNVYIFGQSPTGALGIQPAGTYGNVGGGIFVAEFDATLTTQIFRTTLGPGGGGFGSGMVPVAFLVDVCRNIYISGYSVGTGWTVTPGALYNSGGFYLAAYEPDMTDLIYGTYYVGAGHVDGGTSRFDANGIVYQAVCTSGGFPTTPGAYSSTQPLSWDVGVFKIDFQVAGVNAAGASTLNQGCAPITIDFSNNSTGDTWFWDFGDGSPTVEAYEPSHAYTLPGVYTVTLIALDSLSCNLADTTYLQITIGEQQPVDADFTYVQTIDCDIMEITTVNQSTGNPLTWFWDMGDGTQYADTNVVHQFPGPGQYLVRLIAEDPTGCSDSDTLQVVIDIGPPLQIEAEFTLVEEPGCDQSLATCTVNDPQPTATYVWNMGDGTQLGGTEVTYLYTTPGTWTITLTATDPTTCNETDTYTLDITVPPSEPISASFTAGQTFDCDNLLLTTLNTSTGSNLLYLWELGDGATYTTEDVEHVFSGPGTYTVQLTVTDALGCSPAETVSTEVTIDPLLPVMADFVVAQFGNCVEQSVQVTDLSTGDLIELSWDMGDGTVYTGQPPVHTYALPGQYTITLTVTDLGCGQNATTSTVVTVINELPIVVVGDTVVCPGATATLTATGASGNYVWNTGDTGPSLTVDLGGLYTVTVTADDCQGTASADLIIGPEYDLGQDLEACPNQSLDLFIGIEGITYSWSTGGMDRVERVIGPGTYVFTVIDPLGCPHTDTVRVAALDAEPWVFAPNAFSPDGDGVNDVFKVVGYGDRDVKLTVFNRWGERIWQSASKDIGWDGTYMGAFVKNDVYVYELRYTGVCDAEERRVLGHVSVIR